MAYATTTQLNTEIAARKAGDAALKKTIDALTLRVVSLEARMTALEAAVTNAEARISLLEGPPVEPVVRPWPLPVTTREAVVGPGDVQALIDSQPDGTLIRFAPGTYTVTKAVNLRGRSNLILDFGGAIIINTAIPADLPTSYLASTFFWYWYEPKPSHITIRNLRIEGRHAGDTLHPGEFAAGLHAMGGSYLELDNVYGTRLFGDLVTLNENPDHVWIHGCSTGTVGRNNVSVVCASDVLVEDCDFGSAGYCGFDIEPEFGSIAGASNIVFRDNTVVSWRNSFFSMDGTDAGKPLSDITISRNTCGSLLTVAGGTIGRARPQRVTFEDNIGSGLLKFQHCDGVTVRRNGTATVSVVDCTGVVQ
jgi:hypothetical protein